jgi:rifampicin phosphotransferase
MTTLLPRTQDLAILPLGRPLDPAGAGAKASALSAAAAAGFRTLPGFAITPTGAQAVADGDAPSAVRRAWEQVSGGGRRSLVVRSSSTVEDGETSSMAGMFTSVLDVMGWSAFVEAVAQVVESGRLVHEMADDGDGPSGAMAVLVQPFVIPEVGGVLFGVDPVSGRSDRLAVAAVLGGPDRLVSGEVDGETVLLDRRGKRQGDSALVSRHLARELAAVARKAARSFGGPQDVEWGVVEGRLTVFQVRPVTAVGGGVAAEGPILGAGPVAETFPDALSPLELELWADPMRDALAEVVVLLGTRSKRQAQRSPVLVAVEGRVAVDLELLDLAGTPTRKLAKLDPRPGFRKLRAAWRVGRLRAALPALGSDLLADVDDRLAAVGPLDSMSDRQLLSVLRHTREALTAVYGYEMLAGQLLQDGDASVTAAAEALRVLSDQADGPLRSTAELVAEHPVLLALVPPRIGAEPVLPDPRGIPVLERDGDDEVRDEAVLREALRLRSRWLQELGSRAAAELAERFVSRHRLPSVETVRQLNLERLTRLVDGCVSCDLGEAFEENPVPLPSRFRLTAEGQVVAVAGAGTGAAGGAIGAGGGRGHGVVVAAEDLPARDAVLVVHHLDPRLAPKLPGLQGLVAETGSVLSHLAILARELHVPVAVGVEDAVRRFPPGTHVAVEGDTGDVHVLMAEAS